jgi:hypothetical protein
MKMTLEDFRATVVLSGTDYILQKSHPNFSIKRCFAFYEEYKLDTTNITFFEWLGKQNIVESHEYKHICSLFDTEKDFHELTEFIQKNRPQTKPTLNIKEIQTIMSKHNFIFLTS